MGAVMIMAMMRTMGILMTTTMTMLSMMTTDDDGDDDRVTKLTHGFN